MCLKITEHPQGFKAVGISIENISFDYYNYVMSKAYVEREKCMIKIFIGGGGGRGGRWRWPVAYSSERCLKWGCGGRGVIKGSFQKHLKTGMSKGKSCSQGEGS